MTVNTALNTKIFGLAGLAKILLHAVLRIEMYTRGIEKRPAYYIDIICLEDTHITIFENLDRFLFPIRIHGTKLIYLKLYVLRMTHLQLPALLEQIRVRMKENKWCKHT
jgi:hypothetical protein